MRHATYDIRHTTLTFFLLFCAVIGAILGMGAGHSILPYITQFMRTVLDDDDQNTARTTLGVGTGDSPIFAGTTLTNAAVIGSNSAVFQPAVDSTTFFQVLDDNGVAGFGPIFNIDSTNERIGIGTATPAVKLDIKGDISVRQNDSYYFAGISNPTFYMRYLSGDGLTFVQTGITSLKLNATGARAIGMGVDSPMSCKLQVGSTHEPYVAIRQTSSGAEDGESLCSGMVATLYSYIGGNCYYHTSNNWRSYDTSASSIRFDDGTVEFYADTGLTIGVDYTPTESMKITVAGNVGIGETAPETLLELTHVTPYLTLHNDTHEDTDGGRESRLNFKGEQSGGEETTLARIQASHVDDGVDADDEKGQLKFYTNAGADGDSPTLAMTIDENQETTIAGVIQGATSLWYRATHIPAFAMSPGGSGATFTAPDGNTLGGMNLIAAGHYLYSGDSITSMWDAASDLSLRVTWEVNVDNTAGADADTVDLQLICYYKGDAETTTKSQTVEVPVTIGKSARYKRHTTVFPIDWDLAGNIVENGDKIHFRINLETDTSEVDNVIINTLMFRYPTAKMNPEV